jgi:Thiamine pyrophosphate enzyme, central domain
MQPTHAELEALLAATGAPLPVQPLDPDETFVADFVLAGGAVVREGYAADLATFAERTGLGVLNAFTAKGIFRWDSPYHLGTGCLQERDLALAGARPDAAVLVVGVDTDECPPALLRGAGIEESAPGWRSVRPSDLLSAAPGVRPSWGSPPQPPPQPELFQVLWDIAQPLYKLEGAPLNPARAASDVAGVLGAEGIVCAEPGLAGWWIGRTVPTTRLGSVALPAAPRDGAAVARAYVIAAQGGTALAVVDDALDPLASGLIERAREQGLSFVVEIWGAAGSVTDAADHRERAAAALALPGVTVLEVPIDYSPTAALIDAAGPLVAWGSAP